MNMEYKKNQIIKERNEEYSLFNSPEVQLFIQCFPRKKSTAKKMETIGPFSEFWYTIDWKKVENEIEKMQHGIFKNHTNCRELQELVINSPLVKLHSVRKVGFTNKGRKTAGINGLKKLTHLGGVLLAMRLKIDGKATSIKRVWIPNLKSKEKRPLGIPTIKDRAKQAILVAALEPQWEARFSSRTFGFRPGRRCHDATWNVRNTLRTGPRYVYDADIEKCFDRISHNYLIDKLGFGEFDIITLQIRSWLRAGILDPKDKEPLFPKTGTAQGGVISPLLCNIALHGMESFVNQYLKDRKIKSQYILKLKIYTYADDFVLICSHKLTLFLAINAIREFLKPIGLNIKLGKTRKLHTINKSITYTLNSISHYDEKEQVYVFDENLIHLPVPYGEKPFLSIKNSFNFLGFTFKCFSVGKHNRSKYSGTFALINIWVIPSQDSIDKHFSSIRKNLRKCKNSVEVVKTISPIIKGWLEYFSKSDLRTANKVGMLRTRMNMILLNWQYRRMKTRKRIKENWMTINNDKWRFYSELNGGKRLILPSHSEPKFSLVTYKPIRGNASPYDGNIPYWSIRLKSVLGLTTLGTKILAEQKGICPKCGFPIGILQDAILDKIKHTVKLRKKNKRLEYRVIHKMCDNL